MDPAADPYLAPEPAQPRLLRSVAPTVVWLLTRTALVAMLVHGLLTPGGDRWTRSLFLTGDLTAHYWPAAGHLVAGQVPYRTFAYEYPPGSLPFLAVARWLGGTPASFGIAWVALMTVVDGVVALMLGRERGGRRALWLWIAVVPLIGPVCLARNDVLVAAVFLGGFALLRRGRLAGGGALWGLGILAKLWPVVPLAVWLVSRGRGRFRVLAGAAGVLAVTAAVLAAVGALGPMLTSLVGYHGHRPLEIESSWAVLLMLSAASRDQLLHQTFSYGSINLDPAVVSHSVTSAAYALTEITQLAPIAAAVLLVARRRAALSRATVAWLSLATVATGLAVAPVLSPQYELWVLASLCAVLLVDDGALARAAVWLAAASALATQVEFPFNFRSLTQQKLPALLVTGLRDALLVALAVVAATATWRSARADVAVSAEPAHSPPPTSRIAPVT